MPPVPPTAVIVTLVTPAGTVTVYGPGVEDEKSVAGLADAEATVRAVERPGRRWSTLRRAVTQPIQHAEISDDEYPLTPTSRSVGANHSPACVKVYQRKVDSINRRPRAVTH